MTPNATIAAYFERGVTVTTQAGRLRVKMTGRPDLIARCHALAGAGTVTPLPNGQSEWNVYGDAAIALLRRVRPYMVVNTERVDRALGELEQKS